MIKIAKLDPQPKHIISSGYSGTSDDTFGVNEGIEMPDDHFGISLHEGQFITCPVKVSMEEWIARKIDFMKIDGEWWWVKRPSDDEP